MASKPRKPAAPQPVKAPMAKATAAPEQGSSIRRTASLALLAAILAGFAFAMYGFIFGARTPVAPVAGPAGGTSAKPQEVKDNMQRVIVTLKGIGSGDAAMAEIAAAQEKLLKELGTQGVRLERRYDRLPQLALAVNDAGMALLKSHPMIERIAPDELMKSLGGTEPVKK